MAKTKKMESLKKISSKYLEFNSIFLIHMNFCLLSSKNKIYNKLVRDKIPRVIEHSEKRFSSHVAREKEVFEEKIILEKF